MKKILPVIILAIMAACSNTDTTKKNIDTTAAAKKDTTTTGSQQNSNAGKADSAKTWLVRTIEYEFSRKDISSITPNVFTKEYQAYKDDAISVDMDGGMTPEQFTKKWSSKFNVKNAGQGNGYLIDAQDWNKITVTKCDLKGITADGAFMFNVLIEDVPSKTKYNRDIKVITDAGHFLIADVIEYNDRK